MSLRMIRVVTLALLSLLTACASERVVLDETSGQVQLCAFDRPVTETSFPHGPSGPQSFAADAPIVLQVAGASCLSSSCTEDIVASCSVTLSGQSLRVEADFTWTESSGTCTDDCMSVVATCTTPSLPAGVYTIALGTRSATVTVGNLGPQEACIRAGS